MLKLIFSVFLLFQFYTDLVFVASDCGNHKTCDWATWFQWNPCSNNCGSGTRERYQGVCCRNATPPLGYLACIQDCNLMQSDGHITEPCQNYSGCCKLLYSDVWKTDDATVLFTFSYLDQVKRGRERSDTVLWHESLYEHSHAQQINNNTKTPLLVRL